MGLLSLLNESLEYDLDRLKSCRLRLEFRILDQYSLGMPAAERAFELRVPLENSFEQVYPKLGLLAKIGTPIAIDNPPELRKVNLCLAKVALLDVDIIVVCNRKDIIIPVASNSKEF
jgi:hypothetical protein